MIKKIIMVAFLSGGLATPATARYHVNEFCHTFSRVAQSAMNAYQKGVPLNETLGLFIQDNDNSFNPRMGKIILEAYNKPKWYDDVKKDQAIEEYTDEVYNHCVKEGK